MRWRCCSAPPSLYAIVAMAWACGHLLARHRRRSPVRWPNACGGARKDAAHAALSRRWRRSVATTGRTSTDRRRLYHHLTFYGFLLCFAATSRRDPLSLCLAREAPYPWYDLPVLLGTVGGIGMLVGPAGLLSGQVAAGSEADGSAAARHGRRASSLMPVHGEPDRAGCCWSCARLRPWASCSPCIWAWCSPFRYHALQQVRARHLSLGSVGPLCQGARLRFSQAVLMSCPATSTGQGGTRP